MLHYALLVAAWEGKLEYQLFYTHLDTKTVGLRILTPKSPDVVHACMCCGGAHPSDSVVCAQSHPAGAQWGASGMDVPNHPGSIQVRLGCKHTTDLAQSCKYLQGMLQHLIMLAVPAALSVLPLQQPLWHCNHACVCMSVLTSFPAGTRQGRAP